MNLIFLYLFFGALGGLLIGMLGTGNSFIILPFLTLLFPIIGFPPAIALHSAVGTCMAVIAIAAISAAIAQFKYKQIDFTLLKFILPAYVVGALLAAIIGHFLPAHWLRFYIGILLLLVGIHFIRPIRTQHTTKPIPAILLAIYSFLTAVICGIAGIASGVLLIPFLNIYNIPMKKIIGTSTVCGAIYAIAGAVGYALTGLHQAQLPAFSLGYIYMPAFIGLSISGVIVAPFGVRLGQKLSNNVLKHTFGYLLLVVCVWIMA